MTDTNMPTSAPSRKVVAATGGAGAGAIIANLLNWGLDDYVFDPHAANSVPTPVSAFVLFIVPVALAYLGGYLATRGPEEVAQPVVERVAQIKDESAALREIRDHLAVLVAAQKAAPSKAGVAVKKAVAKRAAKKP